MIKIKILILLFYICIHLSISKHDCSDNKIKFLTNLKKKYEKMNTLTGNANIRILSVLDTLNICENILKNFKLDIKTEIKKFRLENKNIYYRNIIDSSYDNYFKIKDSNRNNENILKKILNIYNNYANKIEKNIGNGVDLYNNEIKQEYQKDIGSVDKNISDILSKYDRELDRNYIKNIKFKFKKYLDTIENKIGKGVDLYTNYVNIQLEQEYNFFDNNIKFFNNTKLNLNKNDGLVNNIFNLFNNFKIQTEKNIGLGIDLSINFIESQLNEEINFFN